MVWSRAISSVSIPQRKIQEYESAVAAMRNIVVSIPQRKIQESSALPCRASSIDVSIPQRKIQEQMMRSSFWTLCRFPFLKGRFKRGCVGERRLARLPFPFLKGRFKRGGGGAGNHHSEAVSIPQRKIQELHGKREMMIDSARFHSSKEDSRGGISDRFRNRIFVFPFLKGRFKSSKSRDAYTSPIPFPFLKGRFKSDLESIGVELSDSFPFLKGRFKSGGAGGEVPEEGMFPFLKGRFKRGKGR